MNLRNQTDAPRARHGLSARLAATAFAALLVACAGPGATPVAASTSPEAAPAAASPLTTNRVYPAPATPADPRLTKVASDKLVLSAGQSADIGKGTTVRFDKVVSDSRCPAGVQCIWAGEVTISVSVTSPQGRGSVELSDRRNAATVAGLELHLLSFGACPAQLAKGDGVECATLQLGPDLTR